ncbi:MAG: SEL1-like repeat protein [Magnetococcales bacterium]|nr:SEL1-like repeat protein [Magnetococcales bacterium]
MAQDDDVAAIRRSAERGDTVAQQKLAELYQLGRSVPKDLAAAYMWLSLAASESDDFSILEKREALSNHMTQAQIVQARERVAKWKPAKP